MATRSTKPRTVVCAILLGVAVLVAWFAQARSRSSASEIRLWVSPASLDFGSVWEQSAFEWQLPISNRSRESIQVWNVESGCTCTTTNSREFSIAPGDSHKLKLMINLERQDWKPGEELASFSVPVTLRITDRLDNHPHWEVAGLVRKNPIHASSPLIRYAESSLIAGIPFPHQSIDLVVPVGSEWGRPTVSVVPPEIGTAEVISGTGSPGRYRLTVKPVDDIPVGTFDFGVVVSVPHEGSAVPPTRTIRVVGQVRHDLGATPETIAFGVRPRGSVATEQVLLRSRGNRSFEVVEVSTDDPDLRVEPYETKTLANEQGYQVQKTIAVIGESRCTAIFQLRYADAPQDVVTVAVPVYVRGYDPELGD